jgi:hypothetical protein
LIVGFDAEAGALIVDKHLQRNVAATHDAVSGGVLAGVC